MSQETSSHMDPTESWHSFTEWSDKSVGLTWKITRMIESVTTPYQRIDLFDTVGDGKLLVHDNAVMLSERFESQYHDALVHSAMLACPNPRRVLIIGGGDGGTLREVLRHSEVEVACQVEIDAEVVRIAKDHLPTMAIAYDDPRADLIIGDGMKFVGDAEPASWDVILIDSTDPIGPAAPLFEEPFYNDIKAALTDDGVMATQVACPTFYADYFITLVKRLETIFSMVRPYTSPVQMYPSGVWGFAVASKGQDLVQIDEKRAALIEESTTNWTRETHKASFAMPNWLRRRLG
jgi:spermidine synthase